MRSKDKTKRNIQGYIIRWLKVFLKKQEKKSKDLESDKKMFWFCLEDELKNYDLNNKNLFKKISNLIYILDNDPQPSLDTLRERLHELDKDLNKLPINPKAFVKDLKKNLTEEIQEKKMWKEFEQDQKEKQLNQDIKNSQATKALFDLK